MSETTGGEVIARMLENEGVEKVFGIIDGTYFGFYAALLPGLVVEQAEGNCVLAITSARRPSIMYPLRGDS